MSGKYFTWGVVWSSPVSPGLTCELRQGIQFLLNLGIVFGILDYSVDYSASSDIRLMTKIRILYSAFFVYSVL